MTRACGASSGGPRRLPRRRSPWSSRIRRRRKCSAACRPALRAFCLSFDLAMPNDRLNDNKQERFAGMNAIAAKGGLFTISGRQWLILLIVQLANMLFGMTITLANLVLPEMRGNLSATQDEISWVITLNLVATAVATPMTGWLSSRLGWRNLMFFTVLGFTVTSLLCGVANSLETLIFARVAQGAFGAPIMPLGQAILLATFPKHLQPTALVM